MGHHHQKTIALIFTKNKTNSLSKLTHCQKTHFYAHILCAQKYCAKNIQEDKNKASSDGGAKDEVEQWEEKLGELGLFFGNFFICSIFFQMGQKINTGNNYNGAL